MYDYPLPGPIRFRALSHVTKINALTDRSETNASEKKVRVSSGGSTGGGLLGLKHPPPPPLASLKNFWVYIFCHCQLFFLVTYAYVSKLRKTFFKFATLIGIV